MAAPTWNSSRRFQESFLLRPDLAEGVAVNFFMAGTTFRDPGYRIARDEEHDIYVLEFVRSGRGRLCCGGETYDVSGGDVYFIQPHVAHEYSSHPADPWEKIWVNFGGRVADALCDAYQLRGRHFFPDCPLEAEFRQLHEALGIPGGAARGESILALHRIFLRLHEWVESHPGRGDDCSEAGRRLRDHLDANVHRTVPLEELVGVIGRSPAQILRIFRRDWGGTPGAYQQKQRSFLARQYLENTDLSLKHLALQLGFRDEFYFSNWFKKHNGISPTGYRRRFRQEKNPPDNPDAEPGAAG